MGVVMVTAAVVKVRNRIGNMNLTKNLKNWLIENADVKESASDDEYKKAASDALINGVLSADKFAELTKDPEVDSANEFLKKIDQLINVVESSQKTTVTEETVEEVVEEVVEQKQVQPKSRFAKMVTELGGMAVEIGNDGKTIDVRVKEAVEQYDNTKTTLCYPETTKRGHRHQLAGEPVKEFGLTKNASTDRDAAQAGAFAKFQILSASPRLAGNGQNAWNALSEHEKELLAHLAEKGEWDASKDGRSSKEVGYKSQNGGFGIKALVDDGGASGALEAAPIVFDDMVIQTPLLHGELYPLVNVVPIDRGRRIEGVSTGTVTGNWGGIDDTAISLFNTNSYISAFDTTIFRWQGAITVGLDFMSDTPIDFGAHITAQYGERLLEDLDDVIAAGNGTTQPSGIINDAGTTIAWGGSTTLGNYESLRFGVSKAEHRPNLRNTAVFCGTETSYQRARAIPVGASDARRLGGMNYDSYQWMERPYAINESLTDQQIFYAIMGRYRMYRRRGLAIRTSTEGDTLIRNNELLIVAMARFGGQIERGACAARTITAPA